MAKFDKMFSGSDVKKAESHPKRETKWIHYTKLIDHPEQYCNEKSKMEIEALADLIEADNGVMQNLLVRKVAPDEYEILAGHKRRRACRLLVEERGKKEYEFLPCTVKCLSNVRAEFLLYSSNRFHDKDDYEKMRELERLKYLIETYPEEFPDLQIGRMVERLSKQMNLKRTTVGEYLTIAKNLGKKGKEEFKTGSLKQSAAVELAALPEKEQEELLEQGVVTHREIKAYKKKKEDVLKFGTENLKEENVPKSGTQEHDKKETTEEEYQVAGQYKVVNTDMEIQEDKDIYADISETEEVENGTNALKEHLEEHKEQPAPIVEETVESDEQQYTPDFFLQEQREKLSEMISNKAKGCVVPEKLLERQKLIVCAMEFYISRMVLK